MKNETQEYPDHIESGKHGWLAGIIILACILLLSAKAALGGPLGDANANGTGNEGDDIRVMFKLVSGVANIPSADINGNDVNGDSVDTNFVFRAYVEQRNLQDVLYTDPRPGMSLVPLPSSLGVSGDDKVSFGPAAANGKRLLGINGSLVTTIPTTGRLVGPVIKVNGAKIPTPLIGRLKSLNARGGWWWSNVSLPGSTADAAVEWYLEYLDESGVIKKTPVVRAGRIPPPNYVVVSVTVPNTIMADQVFAVSADITGTMDENLTAVLTIDGNVKGSSPVVLSSDELQETVVFTGIKTTAGNHQLVVTIIDGPTEATLHDNSKELTITVNNPPPAIPPTLTLGNLVLLPSTPAPGQSVSVSYTLTSTNPNTTAATANSTGTVDGQNRQTITVNIPKGSNTQTVVMPAFVATPGDHTYLLKVGILGIATSSALTKTFTVPPSVSSVETVQMATSALQGSEVVATVMVKKTNVGAPIAGTVRAIAATSGVTLAVQTVQFGAGPSVTASATLRFIATSPAISPISFVVDSSTPVTQTLTVIPPTPPDLVALSATVPATAMVNVPFSVTVSYRADNLPTGNTTKTVDVVEGSTVLASRSFTFNPSVPVGNIVLSPVTMGTTGTRTLTLRLDSNNQLVENNEGNNNQSGTITVTAPPVTPGTLTLSNGPLMPASNMTVPSTAVGFRFLQTRATAGSIEDITIRQVVAHRIGTATNAAVKDITLVNDTSGQVLGTVAALTNGTATFNNLNVIVAKGTFADMSVKASMTGTDTGRNVGFALHDGTRYTMGAVGNTYGFDIQPVSTTLCTTGCTTQTITAPPPPPDLVAISATIPASATAGVAFPVTLSYRADNLPNGDTVKTVDVVEGSTVLASRSFTFNSATPTGSIVLQPVTLGTTGTRTLTLRLDSNNQLPEANESNNTASGAVNVVAGPTPVTPTAPSITRVTVGSGQAEIVASTVANATSYTFSGTTTIAANAARFFMGSSPTPSLTAMGLTNGTQVFVGVDAMNSAGTSPLSTQAAIVPGTGFSVKLVIRAGTELQQATLQEPRTGFGDNRGWRFLNGALWYTSRRTSDGTETFNVTDTVLTSSSSDFWERGNRAAEAGKIIAYGANGTTAVVSAKRRADNGADLQYGVRANGEVFTVAP